MRDCKCNWKVGAVARLSLAAVFAGISLGSASLVMADSINGNFTDIPGEPGGASAFGPSNYAYANVGVGADFPIGRLAPIGNYGVAGWYFNDGAGIAAAGPAGFGVTPPPAGGLAAFLQGTGGAISQTVDATANVTVNFYLEGRSNYDGPNTPVAVSLGSATQYVMAIPGVFTPEVLTFPSSPGNEVLSFSGVNSIGGDNTSFIANVSLQGASGIAVPLPASAGVGFGMLAIFGFAALWKKFNRPQLESSLAGSDGIA